MFGDKDVTTELIQKYLNQFGWKAHVSMEEPGEQEGVVMTKWRMSPSSPAQGLMIDPMVEKGSLVFVVPEIFRAPREGTPEARLNGLFFALAAINGKMILGKFGYQPQTGSVLFQVAMPIEGSKLSYEQFERCLGVTVAMVEKLGPMLQGIIDGTTTAEAILAEV